MVQTIHRSEVTELYEFTVQTKAPAGNWVDRMSCHAEEDADSFAEYQLGDFEDDQVRVVDNRPKATTDDSVAWRVVSATLDRIVPGWTALSPGRPDQSAVYAIDTLSNRLYDANILLEEVSLHFNPFKQAQFPHTDALAVQRRLQDHIKKLKA